MLVFLYKSDEEPTGRSVFLVNTRSIAGVGIAIIIIFSVILWCRTIASVGSGRRVEREEDVVEDSKKHSFSTFDRKISSGKENDPSGAGALKRTLEKENSFLVYQIRKINHAKDRHGLVT